MSGPPGLAYIVSWAPELRIANPPPSLLVKYTRKEKDFFYDYANFVFKLVADPGVSERVRQILATENVRINGPIDIRVMVFPARSFRGQANKMLHGSYNSTSSQISLYPLRIPRDWIRHEGYDLFRRPFADLSLKGRTLFNDISSTAISTLLHEIFHAKLGPRGMARYVEEKIVKSMEENYMKGWEEIITTAVRNALSETQIG
jgi:hypothetical protein